MGDHSTSTEPRFGEGTGDNFRLSVLKELDRIDNKYRGENKKRFDKDKSALFADVRMVGEILDGTFLGEANFLENEARPSELWLVLRSYKFIFEIADNGCFDFVYLEEM